MDLPNHSPIGYNEFMNLHGIQYQAICHEKMNLTSMLDSPIRNERGSAMCYDQYNNPTFY